MNKKILIGIGAVLAVALLAGAAFMAARMLGAAQLDGNAGPLLAGLGAGPGGKGSFSMRIEMTPAPEIPTTHADIVGQVTNIKDNSIFVAEMGKGGAGGGIYISGTTKGSDSGPSTNSDGPGASSSPTATAGPTTEVVVSKDTVIYRDTTMDSIPKPQAGQNTTLGVQQVVAPADISQIAPDYMVQVWGQKRGDRLIAETIVVMGAAVIQVKSGG